MQEPLFNVGMVCKNDAPKPGRFKGSLPGKFMGEMVKLGFPVVNPATGKETLEHMWVKVHTIITPGIYQAGDCLFREELIGKLNNDPIMQCEYECGDDIAFKIEEIEDVFIDFSD